MAIFGQSEVDAVVTDVDMTGGLGGLDLAKMILKTRLNVPFIIASGGHRLLAAELPGDTFFVSKPYGMSDIAAKVGEMTEVDAAMAAAQADCGR
ncbi:hypothetical protein RMR10_006165 [Agrobacterium rosae]|uniref:hypothetical protein n=1 Tax=Agrobacterium rosae TaxID=1972867 RepID=UPI002A1175F7|nr:hypothetical protein [Agrobacterium rosae]MDX8317092.1 hypothetical protein [Agrobacterium rosae]